MPFFPHEQAASRPRRPAYLILIGILAAGMLAAAVFIASAHAQSLAHADLSALQFDQFPLAQVNLDLHGPNGSFLHGVKKSEITLLEDGTPLAIDALQELHPGVQFATAIIIGPALSIRDGLGFSRYDYLLQGINQWNWEQQDIGTDDLSLIVMNGPELIHSKDPGQWLQELNAYQPDARNATPDLQTLSRAMEVVSDQTPRPFMERALLLITTPLSNDMVAGLQDITARALAQQIQISVWLVASPDNINSPSASQLRSMAEQTGGQFFTFSGTEPVPNPEAYLEPLRHIYNLRYSSQITTSGSHQLKAEVQQGDLLLETSPISFELTILQPNLMFVSAPTEIIRSAPEDAQTGDNNSPDAQIPLSPSHQAIKILVEFPDGHPRAIQRTVLYVDGSTAAVNTAEPFDQFDWDLSAYTESGSHVLRVEAVDQLGLTGSSIELPVQVTIQIPLPGIQAILGQRGLIISGVAVLSAGAVLALVLVMAGRIRPSQPARRRAGRFSLPGRKPSRRDLDPVTQPVPIPGDRSAPRQRLPGWINRFQIPSRHAAPRALAYLTPLPSEGEESQKSPPLAIMTETVLIGADPARATLVISDPSIEGLHARLRREAHGFRLYDEDSVAGTWINYTPVSRQGEDLLHGDLIHIGRSGFRFTLHEAGKPLKPVITKLEPGS